MKLRESKGGAYEKRGQFFMRVTVGAQQRRAELLPWCTSLDEAKARAGAVQELVNRLRAGGETDFVEKVVELGAKADAATLVALEGKVTAIAGGKFDRIEPKKGKSTGPVTFRTFAERWTNGDLARDYPDHVEVKQSVNDDVERFEKHIFPHVENVPLVAFTREHADGVMAKLPPALKRGTRRQIAQLINRTLRLAVFANVIKVSPLPPGWLPKAPKAESVAKESLLPSEEAKLLKGRNAAGEVVVPLGYRVAYAFLHREGMRKGEAERLTWGDVDLAKGIVSLDENKTDRPRSWVIDPSVARVLAAWKKICAATKPADIVFVAIRWEKLAPVYREHCEAVGVDRARLFQRKANKLRLRAHDMRAFFITAGMFAGRDALWITDRSGHTTLGMLRTYERDVRRWRELGESPADAFAAIPEFAAVNAAAERGGNSGGGERRNRISARKCTGRELNPYASRRRNLNPLRLPVSPPVR
jgi:integrase